MSITSNNNNVTKINNSANNTVKPVNTSGNMKLKVNTATNKPIVRAPSSGNISINKLGGRIKVNLNRRKNAQLKIGGSAVSGSKTIRSSVILLEHTDSRIPNRV